MGLLKRLFGSETSETELPDWVAEPAREMLQRSVDMGKAGFMPWTGPSVAAIDRSQVAGMRNNQDMAAAFGMQTAMPNIMPATDYGNGVFGHSAMPLYDQNMAELERTRPGQMDYYNSFFVDPVTGVEGSRMQQSAAPVDGRTEWQRMNDEGTRSTMHPLVSGERNVFYGGGGGKEPGDMMSPMQGPSQPGGMLGGYNGIGDWFDGGGPGQSGDTFGGALGGISNATGLSPDRGLMGAVNDVANRQRDDDRFSSGRLY